MVVLLAAGKLGNKNKEKMTDSGNYISFSFWAAGSLDCDGGIVVDGDSERLVGLPPHYLMAGLQVHCSNELPQRTVETF